jgi:hypothetical protein
LASAPGAPQARGLRGHRGLGVYFWTRKLKSRDIDMYIDQDNFYKLQAEALKAGFPIKRNLRLKKFEELIDEVETDIL